MIQNETVEISRCDLISSLVQASEDNEHIKLKIDRLFKMMIQEEISKKTHVGRIPVNIHEDQDVILYVKKVNAY